MLAGLEPGKGNESANDFPQIVGCLLVARFGAKQTIDPAVDVARRGKPRDGRNLSGDLFRDAPAGGERVEPPHGPRIAVVDIANDLHQLGIGGDVGPGARLGVDGAPDGGGDSECEEIRLNERDADRMVAAGDGDETLASVIANLAALLAHQTLDANGVKSASGEHQWRAHLGTGRDRDDDGVDVGLDVDAGLRFEIVCARGAVRLERLKLVPKIGVHDVPDVGKCHQPGILRDIRELVRTI